LEHGIYTVLSSSYTIITDLYHLIPHSKYGRPIGTTTKDQLKIEKATLM